VTSVPTVTAGGVFSTAVYSNTGSTPPNQIIVTVTFPTEAAPTTGSVTLGGFTVTGATALSAVVPSATPNKITFSAQASAATGASSVTLGQVSTQTANLAQSASVIEASTALPANTNLVIDVTSPSLGKQFNQGAGDTLAGDLGSLEVIYNGFANSTATAVFVASPANDTATVAGSFSGIGSTYLGPVAGSAGTADAPVCAATAPGGSFAGAVSSNALTFTGAPQPAAPAAIGSTTMQFEEICVVANGTSIVAANPTKPTAAVSSPTNPGTIAQNLIPYNYNGTVQQILYSGNFSAYPTFIRIVNNLPTAANVFALVQGDTNGTPPGIAALAAVPGNQNVTLSVASIITASGVTPGPFNRVSLTFLSPGTCSTHANCQVGISQIMGNPDGTYVQLGSGGSP
jgi:hypothetical protein